MTDMDDLLPGWVDRCILTRVPYGWHAELTGDPRGIGAAMVTAQTGPTPRAAIAHAADWAGGWRTCTLAQEGDDGGE